MRKSSRYHRSASERLPHDQGQSARGASQRSTRALEKHTVRLRPRSAPPQMGALEGGGACGGEAVWRRECPRGGCSSHYYRPRAAAAAGRGGAGPHPRHAESAARGGARHAHPRAAARAETREWRVPGACARGAGDRPSMMEPYSSFRSAPQQDMLATHGRYASAP